VIYVTQPLRIHRVQSEDGRAQSPAIGPPDDSDWGTRGFPPSHRPTRPTGGGSGGKYLATASMARRWRHFDSHEVMGLPTARGLHVANHSGVPRPSDRSLCTTAASIPVKRWRRG